MNSMVYQPPKNSLQNVGESLSLGKEMFRVKEIREYFKQKMDTARQILEDLTAECPKFETNLITTDGVQKCIESSAKYRCKVMSAIEKNLDVIKSFNELLNSDKALINDSIKGEISSAIDKLTTYNTELMLKLSYSENLMKLYASTQRATEAIKFNNSCCDEVLLPQTAGYSDVIEITLPQTTEKIYINREMKSSEIGLHQDVSHIVNVLEKQSTALLDGFVNNSARVIQELRELSEHDRTVIITALQNTTSTQENNLWANNPADNIARVAALMDKSSLLFALFFSLAQAKANLKAATNLHDYQEMIINKTLDMLNGFQAFMARFNELYQKVLQFMQRDSTSGNPPTTVDYKDLQKYYAEAGWSWYGDAAFDAGGGLDVSIHDLPDFVTQCCPQTSAESVVLNKDNIARLMNYIGVKISQALPGFDNFAKDWGDSMGNSTTTAKLLEQTSSLVKQVNDQSSKVLNGISAFQGNVDKANDLFNTLLATIDSINRMLGV